MPKTYLFFAFRLDFRGHVAEHEVLPNNVASWGESDHRACVKTRDPNHKRRVLLAHALRAFDGTATTFAYPAEPELQKAKYKRHRRHQRELSTIPQVGKAHLADVEACFGQNNKHRERPHEHRVFLILCGTVGKFRIKVAKPKCKRQGDADNRLDRVENLHRNFREVRLSTGQIAKDNRDAEARNQVSAKENLERQGRTAAKHFCHRRRRIRGRAKRNNRTAQKYFARQVEKLHNAPEGSDDNEACDKRTSFNLERVTMRLRRNLRHEREEHHDADSERQERRQKVRLRNENARKDCNGHENRT